MCDKHTKKMRKSGIGQTCFHTTVYELVILPKEVNAILLVFLL